MLFEGAHYARYPPDVDYTVSSLDNLARFQEASLQDYFRLLNGANVGSTSTYTVVLWTGPSGGAKAEQMREPNVAGTLSFDCWKCSKMLEISKKLSKL